MSLQVAPGCRLEGGGEEGFAAALKLARAAELVVLALGESGGMSGENASRAALRLPGRQEALALAVAVTGTPVVLVLVSGRPLDLVRVEPQMAAILAAWQPGTRTGRLGAYQDTPTSPLYAFGHGLSYTTFAYSPIRLSRPRAAPGETLTAEVTVANTGERPGIETVLWLIRDPVASITRPLRQLKHFEAAPVAPGASRVFRFDIEPERDLAFPDADGQRILEPGEIVLFAGSQSVHFAVTKAE